MKHNTKLSGNTLDDSKERTAAEEHLPAVFEVEKPIHPEDTAPAARHKKKLISIRQILLLLFLFWLSWEEGRAINSVVFFPLFLFTLWGILRKRDILPDKVKAFIAPWWTPCHIRLRAFHIKLIRGRESQPVDDRISTCLNCGTTYTGNFCPRCGQSRTTTRYRLSSALCNIAGGFFNIDNGFGRTLLELLYRPGYMIRNFIGGKRAEYFRPFQTLFILAALYIMAVQLVDPEALSKKEEPGQTAKEEIIEEREELVQEMEKVHSQQEKEALAIAIKSLDSQLAAKKDSTSNLIVQAQPESGEKGPFDELNKGISDVGDKLKNFLQDSPFLQKVWNLLKSWGHGNKAFRIIATLPLFAIATRLAFRLRKHKLNYNTTEHIFIQAYIACQILLLSIIMLPFNGQARVDDLYELPLWSIFLLFCWDYKQLYRCTWWKSFWRTVLMLFYSFVLIILLASLVIALMLAGIQLLNFFW